MRFWCGRRFQNAILYTDLQRPLLDDYGHIVALSCFLRQVYADSTVVRNFSVNQVQIPVVLMSFALVAHCGTIASTLTCYVVMSSIAFTFLSCVVMSSILVLVAHILFGFVDSCFWG